MTRAAVLLLAVLAVAARVPPAAAAMAIAPAIADIPSGDYALDKSRASITFRISHYYVSSYAAHFMRFDARLHLEPADPARTSVATTIDPRSLTLDTAPAGFRDTLLGPDLLDVVHYPAITFRSTSVTLIGRNQARVTGDFTAHGVTRPVVLMVTFQGGSMGAGQARLGFIGKTRFKRSAFGLGYGSKLIAGDDVMVDIEAEFVRQAPSK
jgi:polyisoprenoid-binding protein YceI